MPQEPRAQPWLLRSSWLFPQKLPFPTYTDATTHVAHLPGISQPPPLNPTTHQKANHKTRTNDECTITTPTTPEKHPHQPVTHTQTNPQKVHISQQSVDFYPKSGGRWARGQRSGHKSPLRKEEKVWWNSNRILIWLPRQEVHPTFCSKTAEAANPGGLAASTFRTLCTLLAASVSQ